MLVKAKRLSDRNISTTSNKEDIKIFNWRITVWIGKPWALEGLFLLVAKRADPPKNELFGAVTRLESGLA
jgi:hypothetical protein